MRSFALFGPGPTPPRLDQNGIYFWHLDFMGTGTEFLEEGDFLWLRQQLMGGEFIVRHTVAAGVGLLKRGEQYTGIFPVSAQYNYESETVALRAWPGKLNSDRWYTITRILDMKGKRSQGIQIKDSANNEVREMIHVSDPFWPGYDDQFNPFGYWDVIDRIRFGHDWYPNLKDYYYDNIQFIKAKRISGIFTFDPPGAPTKFKGDYNLVPCTLIAYPVGGGSPVKMPFNPFDDIINDDVEFASALMPGSYDAYIQIEGFLSKRLGRLDISDTNGDINVGNFVLQAGDINGDDVISTDDYLIFNQTFDLAPENPLFDPRADLDADGYVTTDDYLLFNFNFDQVGALHEDGRLD